MSNKHFFSETLYDEYTSGCMSISEFKRQMDDGSIITPTYQRNFVWTAAYKQRYLETLSKKGPIFGFVMNYNGNLGHYELIDGQNRGKTIYEFMNDEIKFNKDGYSIKYSDIVGNEKRIFDRQEIHFIKTINWDEDESQEYFRCIQDGMKLTNGEQIHSAQNNLYQKKIVELSDLFNDIITSPKKKGGLNYVNKRFLHYEIIGCILKIFMDGQYYDRPGQTALRELKRWDTFNPETDIENKELLENGVRTFKKVMNYYIQLRNGSINLNNMSYSRDSTFIRGMYFLYINKLYLENNGIPNQMSIDTFNSMMGIILKKKTPLYDYITLCGTNGEMDKIMDQYKRVYNDPGSVFIQP